MALPAFASLRLAAPPSTRNAWEAQRPALLKAMQQVMGPLPGPLDVQHWRNSGLRYGAGEALQAVHSDCGHDFPDAIRQRAYRFIAEALGCLGFFDAAEAPS